MSDGDKPRVSSSWRLYFETFAEGEHVIVITDRDLIYCGSLKTFDECVVLTTTRGSRRIEFDEIRFMAHGGFPVRRLLGADGSLAIEETDTADTSALLREELTREFGCRSGTSVELVFGDPWYVEPCQAALINPGRTWRNGYMGMEYEETVILRAADGAMGLLYDVPTIYWAEFAGAEREATTGGG